MTLFSWVMIAIFVVFVAGILALGLYSPRSGADVLGWRPTRERVPRGALVEGFRRVCVLAWRRRRAVFRVQRYEKTH